ncbi:MAG: hypothetical protein SynsKO_31810 [Synoicihabitans sp.]
MNYPTSGFSIRPRFEQIVPTPIEQTREQLQHALESQPEGFEIKSNPGMIVVHIPERKRRRWSPRLQLGLDRTDSEKTLIAGVYGPEHEVWALFVLGYIATGLLAVFSGIYGGVQLFLKDEPWALWITGSMVVIAGVLYLLAQFGQKLGAWQTFQLHHAFEEALESVASDTSDSLGGHI